jgi:hypothetical protein
MPVSYRVGSSSATDSEGIFVDTVGFEVLGAWTECSSIVPSPDSGGLSVNVTLPSASVTLYIGCAIAGGASTSKMPIPSIHSTGLKDAGCLRSRVTVGAVAKLMLMTARRSLPLHQNGAL